MSFLLSIVIPTLNEAKDIVACLEPLKPLREQGVEIIVADGGSEDDTRMLAEPLVDKVLTAPRGRSFQMNVAASHAAGEQLLFLHADTQLPDNFLPSKLNDERWGFFSVKLSGESWLLRNIEWWMNLRSKMTGIGTGDQALFVRRDLFNQLGGFAPIPLMEDVEICRRLKIAAKPSVLPDTVTTSSRRWEQRGIIRTVLQMWRLRFAYFLGVSPARLVRQYYPE